MDSSKTGLCVKPDKFREDQKTWDYPLPYCMMKGVDFVENRAPLQPASNNFVLDVLMRKGELIRDQHLTKYEERVFHSSEIDPDLTAPITHAIERIGHRNRAIRDELTKLEEHVERIRRVWRTYWGSKSGRRTVTRSKSEKLADKLAETRWMDEIRNDFASNPGPDEIGILLALDPRLVAKLKASIAAGTSGRPSDKFAFAMAYETLLTIKAEASSGVSPIARSFGDILGVSLPIGRFYSQ